ncbi:MAG: hypothetical protein RLZZ385_686 [Pseudomonadota bacterium]|jgi:esterase/lipase
MNGKRVLLVLLVSGILLVLMLGLRLGSASEELTSIYQPSGSAAVIPTPQDSFADYVIANRERIRVALSRTHFARETEPFGAGYDLETVVDMRSPYELAGGGALCDASGQGAGMGFLLTHGLTDSPYLLRTVAQRLQRAYPCALVRGLLMPGHGTVPGDLLDVHRQDWLRTIDWAVEGYRGLVNELYLVGYSNGSAISLRHVQTHADDDLVAGLILLSPGLKARESAATLSPYARYVVKWAGQGEDRDAAKYESMAMNAAAEFHLLTLEVMAAAADTPALPIMMVMSADDMTVDTQAALQFLCEQDSRARRLALWYNSRFSPAREPSCPGAEVVDTSLTVPRFLNHSHVAITLPADDPHYGLDGRYPNCRDYNGNPADLQACRSDNANTVYGESNVPLEDGRYEGMLVRRATFNPLFNAMLDKMFCFIEEAC